MVTIKALLPNLAPQSSGLRRTKSRQKKHLLRIGELITEHIPQVAEPKREEMTDKNGHVFASGAGKVNWEQTTESIIAVPGQIAERETRGKGHRSQARSGEPGGLFWRRQGAVGIGGIWRMYSLGRSGMDASSTLSIRGALFYAQTRSVLSQDPVQRAIPSVETPRQDTRFSWPVKTPTRSPLRVSQTLQVQSS